MHRRELGEDQPRHDRKPVAAVAAGRSSTEPGQGLAGRTAGPVVQRCNPAMMLALQRAAGNSAVARALTSQKVADSAPTVQRDDDTSTGPPTPAPATAPRLLPGSLFLADTGEFLRNRPTLAPTGVLPVLPPAQITGLIDWGDVGAAYRNRRLTLENRDRELIIGHWQRWYPVAQALHRLPGASALFDTPAAIMNTMSAKMIDSALAGDNPDVIERFNRQAEQFGVSTTTVSVTVKRF